MGNVIFGQESLTQKAGAFTRGVEQMVSIWLFIGISLAVNGALILAAGIYQLIYPPANSSIVLFELHANVWWGVLLLTIGAVYCFLFAPRRQR